MNNKNINFTVILFSIIFIIFLITNNKDVLESINFSISIWKDNIFPCLFPFFIVSNILIHYGFIELIEPYFKTFMNKMYNLPSSCSYALILSLFSGFPSGAKYIVNLLDKRIINDNEANRLLTFTHYSNPLFIIGFIGSIIFNSKIIGFIILISHILSGLITGYIFNRNKCFKENNSYYILNSFKAIGKVLSDSILDSLNTLFLLLGIVTIFSLIISLFQNIFNFNDYFKVILSGLLEMTQGIKNINLLNISLFLKVILVTIFISFGGFSVHIQVLSIISSYKIKYKYFLVSRIIHSIIASILVSILYILHTNIIS